MNDLIAFLRARLDEDEAAAQAACWDEQSDVWAVRPPQARYEQYTVVDYLGDGVVVVAPENADADGVGQHVARHDPARVLREVEAKRRIVKDADLYLCDSGPGCGYRTKHGHTVLRLLALPYADHPDYRSEWRP